MNLERQLNDQQFPNGYMLVNGVQSHAELGDRFQIVNPWFRKNTGVGHFVELRIDSDRFSAHPDAPVNCECTHCKGPATKPILCHEQPGSMLRIPRQDVPSRGWGEQFWVKIAEREGPFFKGVIDNPLFESRLHELNEGDAIFFHEDHILAVHGIHNDEIIQSMDEQDLGEFERWVQSQNR